MPELGAPLVPCHCEVDEPPDEVGVRYPRGAEEAGVDAGPGEAGNGVDLVQDEARVRAEEEVDASKAAQVERDEDTPRSLLDPGGCTSGSTSAGMMMSEPPSVYFAS